MIFRCVDGNPVQPSVEGTVASEKIQRAISLDEGFLCDIFHFVRVFDETGDQCSYFVLIAQDQQIERCLIAIEYSLNQLLICVFVHKLRPLAEELLREVSGSSNDLSAN